MTFSKERGPLRPHTDKKTNEFLRVAYIIVQYMDLSHPKRYYYCFFPWKKSMTLLVWEKFTFFSFFFLKKCLLKFWIRVGTKVLRKNHYFLHLLKIFQIRGMLLPAAFGYFLAKLVTLNNEAILFPIRVGTEVFC